MPTKPDDFVPPPTETERLKAAPFAAWVRGIQVVRERIADVQKGLDEAVTEAEEQRKQEGNAE